MPLPVTNPSILIALLKFIISLSINNENLNRRSLCTGHQRCHGDRHSHEKGGKYRSRPQWTCTFGCGSCATAATSEQGQTRLLIFESVLGARRYNSQSCVSSSDCCYGLICTGSHCNPKPCTPKDGTCITSLDCCGRLVCFHPAQSWKDSWYGEL